MAEGWNEISSAKACLFNYAEGNKKKSRLKINEMRLGGYKIFATGLVLICGAYFDTKEMGMVKCSRNGCCNLRNTFILLVPKTLVGCESLWILINYIFFLTFTWSNLVCPVGKASFLHSHLGNRDIHSWGNPRIVRHNRIRENFRTYQTSRPILKFPTHPVAIPGVAFLHVPRLNSWVMQFFPLTANENNRG